MTYQNKLIARLSLIFVLFSSTVSVKAQVQTITIDGSKPGRIFDGIGAVSAGGASRLLIEYPEPQRSQILDYLFKPDYGAALQILKVEIGSDTNSSDGAEPGSMRTADDQNYRRGYEWWLMKEARARNPQIKLYALEWGAPSWVSTNGHDLWSDANVTYVVSWLKHAKSQYGLSIDYVGGWSEKGYDTSYYEKLRAALDSSGFAATKLVCDDSFGWSAARESQRDIAFARSFNVMGQHYSSMSPDAAKDLNFVAALQSGKPLWQSEMGAQPFDTGAPALARSLNAGYINLRNTAYIDWALVWSACNPLPFHDSGLILADEPWSGHYDIGEQLWTLAHFTQFAQPGWSYIDSGCRMFGDPTDGSCITLVSPNHHDLSIILETTTETQTFTVNLKLAGGLQAAVLHVWKTNLGSSQPSDWFARQPDILQTEDSFTVTLQPNSLYTLTTLNGAAKGAPTVAPPASMSLSLPYTDNFSNYFSGAAPRLFSDQNGAFEIAPATGGRRGNCLRQVVTSRPISWDSPGSPCTILGDNRWEDYQVSSDVLLEQPGSVDLVGRITGTTDSYSSQIDGYHLRLSDTGNWSLLTKHGAKETVLKKGTAVYSLNTWHTLSLQLVDNTIGATLDGTPLVSGLVDDTYDHGIVGLVVGSWQGAEFQNFSVTPLQPAASVPDKQIVATASSSRPGSTPSDAVDDDLNTTWRSPATAGQINLPQSITLDLGRSYLIDRLRYDPNGDGPGGWITQYNVFVCNDGKNFGAAVYTGMWNEDSTPKFATLQKPVAGRFIKLVATMAHGGFAAAAEIKVYGTPQ